ncbi:hypothetical protein EV183_002733 [Coemansia sp. RSA 2336]|nr:hypothetical protein EV183_002733 [Coemansia sp. RSA 2336]
MEFSQRPAHQPLSGAHGFITAAAAPASTHYYVGQDAPRQVYYSAPAYAPPPHHPQQQPSTDIYAGSPRRLPSVSELLVSPDTPQNAAAVQPSPNSAPRFDRSVQQGYAAAAYAQPAYPVTGTPKGYAIDVPSSRVPDYGVPTCRDSESAASSVSSHGTLVDSYLPAAQNMATKQQHSMAAVDRGMCEEDVFTAASILMSFRTCKMPC